MREYDYRTTEVPRHLNSTTIQDEFTKNIKQGFYDSKSKYNDTQKDVKDTLKKMYHYKCAFCEDTLKNSHGHIEHYRPKKSSEKLTKCDGKQAYYWLAFSWDNLLPCCEICNGFKSNCFGIKASRITNKNRHFLRQRKIKWSVSYSRLILKDYTSEFNMFNQDLKELHKSLKAYNLQEEPKLLHPEIDTFEEDICFSKQGKILSKNDRVKYTVRICRLNRNGLSELREIIIGDYTKEIKKYLQSMIKMKRKKKIETVDMLELISISFDKILEKSNIDKKFSLVSLNIYNNFNFFVDGLSLQNLNSRSKCNP